MLPRTRIAASTHAWSALAAACCPAAPPQALRYTCPTAQRVQSRRLHARSSVSQGGGRWVDEESDDWILGGLAGAGRGSGTERRTRPDAASSLPDPAAVIHIRNVSKSLVASDFFRIGPQGKHIEGWNSSLVEVLQLLNPSSLEPLGQYLLVFSSPAAAACWRDDAQRRHLLSRDVHSPRQTARFAAAPAAAADGMAYSLLPGLLALRSCLLAPAWDPTLRGSSDGSATPSAPYPALQLHRHRAALRARLRDALLGVHLVLVRVAGGQLSKSEFVAALTAEAGETRRDWGVRRVRWWKAQRGGSVDSGGGGGTDASAGASTPDPEASDSTATNTTAGDDFSDRFILSFADEDQTLRFVRWWHKKTLVVGGALRHHRRPKHKKEWRSPVVQDGQEQGGLSVVLNAMVIS